MSELLQTDAYEQFHAHVTAYVTSNIERAREMEPAVPAPTPVGTRLSSLTWMDRNTELRRILAARWSRADDAERLVLARWYVFTWGGVRANKEAKLQSYASQNVDDLAAGPLTGVASWSKILAMRAPSKFVIYDARVGFALNALQVVATGKIGVHFRVPPPRHTLLAAKLPKLNSFASAGSLALGTRTTFPTYITLSKSVAGFTNEEVEMTLFALAEDLAKSI